MSFGRPVYLDYQATTPVDPDVLAAMEPFWRQAFGNPHSRTHEYGWEAENAVDLAREQVALALGARSDQVVFTSGATEANNLAILGAARARGGERRHVITFATEHPCVLGAVAALRGEGFRTTVLPVDEDGYPDLNRLEDAIGEDTAIVSVMAANNEIGTLAPLEDIVPLCRRHGAWLHTDIAQAAGKIPFAFNGLGADLASVSGHKIYGPMGVGALLVREGVRLDPIMKGGGQEGGLRPGTLPVPLIVGLGAALEKATSMMEEEGTRTAALRDRLLTVLSEIFPDLHLNGPRENRLPGNLNFRLPGVDSDELLPTLKDAAVSTGSACSSADRKPSHVLAAIGLDAQAISESIRLSVGRFTTEAEIDRVIECFRHDVRDAFA